MAPGSGGLACAIDLAAQGREVTVVERAATAGGKMRETMLGRRAHRQRPDRLHHALGVRRIVRSGGCIPSTITSRCARWISWRAMPGAKGERFDLFADIPRAAEAVGEFSGPAEARRFLDFCAEARTIYQTLKAPFLAASRPNPVSLSTRIGLHRPGAPAGAIRPFDTLWSALSRHFHDPRLRQLFGRYATYGGSSPFLSPATLMLIAHVEQDGRLDHCRRHATPGRGAGKPGARQRCRLSVRPGSPADIDRKGPRRRCRTGIGGRGWRPTPWW